jgi:hypothetical protein
MIIHTTHPIPFQYNHATSSDVAIPQTSSPNIPHCPATVSLHPLHLPTSPPLYNTVPSTPFSNLHQNPNYICISTVQRQNVSPDVHPYKSRHMNNNDVPVGTGIIDSLFGYAKPLWPLISELPVAMEPYKIGITTKHYTV